MLKLNKMKIYAVVCKVKEMAGWWDVICYFSLEREKCEEYLKISGNEYLQIKEYESETNLDIFSQIRW